MTDEYLDGWKIEDILMTIQNDMFRRTQKIVGDSREEARAVLNNNVEILGLLSQCIEEATELTRILNRSFGLHKDRKPRIGVV